MKNQRNTNLAKIHLDNQQLGLDDVTYGRILMQTTGKDSAAKCTDRQLEKVVKTFEEKGWKQNKNIKRYRKVPTGRFDLQKIYALWGQLQDMGVVKSTNLVELDKWVSRMTKGKRSSAQFLEESWAQRIIECLKKWIAREESKRSCHE